MKKQWAMIVLAVIVFSLTTDRSDAAQKRSRPTASRKPRVSELRSVEGFKAAFQNGKGKVRLVALVSPT